jgi:opacity protein-like surface antigen
MKSLVLRSIAVIAICVSIPAHAADMAIKAPPPTVPVAPYNWSGLYVGGNFGGAWTSGNLNIPGNNFYGGLTEFIGGVQAGYNFQTISCMASKVISTGRLSITRRCRPPPSVLLVSTGLGQRQPELAWCRIVGSSTASWVVVGYTAAPR